MFHVVSCCFRFSDWPIRSIQRNSPFHQTIIYVYGLVTRLEPFSFHLSSSTIRVLFNNTMVLRVATIQFLARCGSVWPLVSVVSRSAWYSDCSQTCAQSERSPPGSLTLAGTSLAFGRLIIPHRFSGVWLVSTLIHI